MASWFALELDEAKLTNALDGKDTFFGFDCSNAFLAIATSLLSAIRC